MARKNRKKRKLDGFIFMLPMPFAGLVVLLSAFALGYVWLGCRCEALGRDLKSLENEQEALHKEYLNEEYKWIRMKSPHELEKSLERHNIIMTWPKSDQVVRLSDLNLFEEPVGEEDDDTLQFARLERMIMNE
jgi:hypothetical protein